MKIWVTVLWVAAAFAQAPAPAPKNVIGEVTAIDAGSKQFTVKADNGTSYTVKQQDRTSFLRMTPGEKDIKKASPIKFDDLGVGDRVLARGPLSDEDKTLSARTVVVMTKTDLAKKHEADREAWQKGIVGIVTAVNPDTKEITVKQRGMAAKTVVVDTSAASGFLRYAPGSYRFDEAKPGTFSDIKPGDNLRAYGEKNEDGSKIKAEQVLSGSFSTFAGTVISVDAANGTVKVNDLQTKKPVEIKTTGETLVRRMPEMMATMMARRMNAAQNGAAGVGAPGGAGGPGGQRGQGGGQPPQGARQEHAPGGEAAQGGGPGGPGGPGGGRGFGRGNFDLQSALEHLPPLQLSELKPGDALIVSSTKGTNPGNMTAITVVAGVEPFLASAPRTAGQVNLGSWSFDGGVPAQ